MPITARADARGELPPAAFAEEFGPCQCLTQRPLTVRTYVDASGKAGAWYMVRAVILQAAPTGTYSNLSQGIFAAAKGM